MFYPHCPQSVFTNVDDQEVVGYYTTCEGSNVFSETLAVAYLQGMAASDLLSSVDADAFEATCPDKVRDILGSLSGTLKKKGACNFCSTSVENRAWRSSCISGNMVFFNPSPPRSLFFSSK